MGSFRIFIHRWYLVISADHYGTYYNSQYLSMNQRGKPLLPCHSHKCAQTSLVMLSSFALEGIPTLIFHGPKGISVCRPLKATCGPPPLVHGKATHGWFNKTAALAASAAAAVLMFSLQTRILHPYLTLIWLAGEADFSTCWCWIPILVLNSFCFLHCVVNKSTTWLGV